MSNKTFVTVVGVVLVLGGVGIGWAGQNSWESCTERVGLHSTEVCGTGASAASTTGSVIAIVIDVLTLIYAIYVMGRKPRGAKAA